MHVLIVEDDATTREMMCEVFARMGMDCECVGSCSEAREKLAGMPFRVVVLDNGLPDGMGLDLIAEARAHGARVIMATADGHRADFRARAHARGAEVVFDKPFDVIALGEWILKEEGV